MTFSNSNVWVPSQEYGCYFNFDGEYLNYAPMLEDGDIDIDAEGIVELSGYEEGVDSPLEDILAYVSKLLKTEITVDHLI
jgi:hypothetical protein